MDREILIAGFYALEKAFSAKSKTRHEFVKKVGEIEPFYSEDWVYLTQGRKNYKKPHQEIEPEYSLSGRNAGHITSIFFPFDNLIYGYGNNKRNKEDLYIFLMNPMEHKFEIFVFKGLYKSKIHILSLFEDGEFDEQINLFRSSLNKAA